MLIHLTSATDVGNFLGIGDGLPDPEDHVVVEREFVFPEGLRPVVPATESEPAYEVHRAVVRLEKWSDVKDDGYHLTCNLQGWPLTKAGARSKSQGYGGLTVGNDDAIRWELRRAVLKRGQSLMGFAAYQPTEYDREQLKPYDEAKAERVAKIIADQEAWDAKIKARADALVAESEAAKA